LTPSSLSTGSKQYFYNFPEQQQQAPPPQEEEQPVLIPPSLSTGSKQYFYNFPEQQLSATTTNSIKVYDPITGKTQYYYNFPEQGMTAAGDEQPKVEPDVILQQSSDGQLVLFQNKPLELQQQPMSSLAQHSHKGDTNRNHYLRHDSKNNHQSSNKHIQYYFYDPKDTKKDQHGRIHLPQYVYDAYGRITSFKALSSTWKSKSTTSSSPTVTMIHQNSSVLNATVYNFTHSHPPVVETRQKRKLSFPKQFYTFTNLTSAAISNTERNFMTRYDMPSSTTSTDSSIIICTVGVMALFVGALSARRMRSHQQRSLLSICIENEHLESDAAYDTAYTTTTNNPNNTIFGSASQYNTFAQGWRGDLEKFDV
jgi:hypothetical protein